jgi:hypothetical protein
MIFDTSTYLLTLAVGLPVVALAWFVAHRTQRRSWPWRAGISALLAVTIAPTASSLYGEVLVSPAVWMLRILFWNIADGSNRIATCLTFGVFPIVLTGAIIFACWSLLSRRPDV